MNFAPPAEDELPLIYDSWAKAYRTSPWAGTVPNHLWDTVSRASFAELLDRSRVMCAVVALDEGRRVMGYSVSQPGLGILHWLYVKRDYRGMGVGRALLADVTQGFNPISWAYTHRTKAAAKFLGPGWTHDPVPARVKS